MLSSNALTKLASEISSGRVLAVIHGEDQGVVDYTYKKLADKIKLGVDKVSPNLIAETKIGGQFEDVLERLEAQDLWGGQKLFCLRLETEKQATKVVKLINMFEARPFPNCLIILARKLARKGAMFKAIEKSNSCVRVEVGEDTIDSLSQVINEVFEAHAVRTDADVVQFLASTYMGLRDIALREAEKLSLYGLSKGGELSISDFLAHMGPKSNYAFQDLIYPTLAGDLERVPKAVNHLFESGKAGVSILRALQNETQRMIDVKLAINRGDGRPQFAARPPIFQKDWPEFQARLKLWQMPHLIRILQRIAECEARSRQESNALRALVLGLMVDLAQFAHTQRRAA